MYPFVAEVKMFPENVATLDYMREKKPKKTPISIRFDAGMDESIRVVQEEFGMSYGNAVRLLVAEALDARKRGPSFEASDEVKKARAEAERKLAEAQEALARLTALERRKP